MAEPLVQVASRLAECCTLLAMGYNLKQTGILRTSDGETAIKVATTLTLPSVIVQALGNGGPLGSGSVSLLGVAAVAMGAQLAATWLYVMHRPVRERSLLSGCCTGLSLRLFGYPLVECFLGGPAAGAVGAAAVQAVALVDCFNHLAVWLGSYLLFAGAGPAFPESFKHDDGGDYRGQWRGMRKEGLGVYTYASGARYEGEWRNNVKEGRGVYYFPKGGVYEGEWSGGSMNGLGVRTLSSGQVKSGRWRDGQLETPLEMWQVALAADGAAAVAAAARSVEVGGGRLVDALHQLAAQPTLWALLAGLAINLSRVPLPTSVDLITGVLAHANAPLMLLAAGITAPKLAALPGVSPGLLADVARLLGSRLLVPLAVGLNLVALLATSSGAGSGGVGFRVASATLAPLAAALVALLAPVPPQALANARRFRLNETTAAAITSASYIVCVPLMILAGVAACAAGLAVAAAPPSCAAAAVAAAACTADARPLGVFTLAAAAAVSAVVAYVSYRSTETAELSPGGDRRVLMVYAGPPGTVQSSPSASPSVSTSVGEGFTSGGTVGPVGKPGSGTTASPSSSAGAGTSSGGGLGGSGTDAGGTGGGGGPDPGGAGSRRAPPSAAAAAAVPPARGAASCWGGRGGTLRAGKGVACCCVRTSRTVSRAACAAAAAAANSITAPAAIHTFTVPPTVASAVPSRHHGGCCGSVAMRFGAASKGVRGQGQGLCAAVNTSSPSTWAISAAALWQGSSRGPAGLPKRLVLVPPIPRLAAGAVELAGFRSAAW